MPSDTPPANIPVGAHYGRLSDGKTAGARDCSVRLDLAGLEVTPSDGSRHFRWPFESLRAGEPVRAHSIDVLLSSTADPGVTLFVPGVDFVKDLANRAPHLTTRAERWRHARPWIIGAAAIIGAIALVNAAGWSPMRTLAGFLPDSWRDRLGAAAIGSMTENKKRCSAPAGLAALEKLTARLSTAAGSAQKFRIVVIDWDLLNAFAVPGNQIVMTKGLIEKAESADEVAGVLAHEMGHGIEMHPETGIIRAVGLSAAVELMMGGSGGTLANMGLMLAQLGYNRAAEREADGHALELLRKVEISQQGLAAFFRRVIKEEEGDDADESANPKTGETTAGKAETATTNTATTSRAFDMLRTHPPTTERADMIRRTGSYAATPALDPGGWQALKSICSTTDAAP
ncbi:MAG: M48 family metallopeptidase [Hyphomicrobium sp.]